MPPKLDASLSASRTAASSSNGSAYAIGQRISRARPAASQGVLAGVVGAMHRYVQRVRMPQFWGDAAKIASGRALLALHTS